MPIILNGWQTRVLMVRPANVDLTSFSNLIQYPFYFHRPLNLLKMKKAVRAAEKRKRSPRRQISSTNHRMQPRQIQRHSRTNFCHRHKCPHFRIYHNIYPVMKRRATATVIATALRTRLRRWARRKAKRPKMAIKTARTRRAKKEREKTKKRKRKGATKEWKWARSQKITPWPMNGAPNCTYHRLIILPY